MRVSHAWLQDFVELQDLTPSRIAELLTISGTEVERIEEFGAGLDQVVVAEVVEVSRLAGSDHLWLAQVRVPDAEPVEVVCGAPNLAGGAVVAFAPPGSQLPTGMRITERRILGTLSHGMICAADELGLGVDHEGVLLLPPEEAEPGRPLSALFPRDTVYELEILSHRADCLCHLGVARELAAVLDRRLRLPELKPPVRSGEPAAAEVEVSISDPGDCPLYIAERLGCRAGGAAPLWLQRRLLAVGSRPISAVVDLANYVMLEVGEPLHAFDFGQLHEGAGKIQVEVRRGREGESLRCLDGEQRGLGAEDLVIAAGGRPVALAGVIGGADTAVGKETTELLLEAASFNWVQVRRAGRRLALRTEASARFERSLSPALAPLGSARFLSLVGEVAGGRVRPGPVAAGALAPPAPPIVVSASAVSALLGLEVAADTAAGALRRLGFSTEVMGDRLEVMPGAERTDVRIAADIAEEVGRILGYDQLPATLPAQRTPPAGDPALVSPARLAAELCLGAGFTEAVTSSLTNRDRTWAPAGLGEGLPRLRLQNPLSAQLGALRSSCLPGLLECCRLNQARGGDRTRLFEWGRVFWPGEAADGRPEEPEVLALVDHVSGSDGPSPEVRLDRLLQVVAALGERLSPEEAEFRPAAAAGFDGARCVEVWVAGRRRGVLGEVDLAVDPGGELRGSVVAAEVRVDGWLVAGGRPAQARALAKTPALSLDLAVAVPERAQLGPALRAVRAAGVPRLERIRLLDQYHGSQLAPETKGWTFRLTFRDPERTLTHREGEQLRAAVLQALQPLGAAVRVEAD